MNADRVGKQLEILRKRGWRVAVHNDYEQDGKPHTFWLFTASFGPYFAKGESSEDYYALNQVLNQADDIERKVKANEVVR